MTIGDDGEVPPRQVHVSELLAAHGRTVSPSGRRRRRVEPADVPAGDELPPVGGPGPVPLVEVPVVEVPTVAEADPSVLDLPDAAAGADPVAVPILVEDEPGPVDDHPVPVTLVPDPAPVDPAPVDPAPSDPAPSDPAPSDPAPSDPAPSDPIPVDGDAPAAPSSPVREWALVGVQLVGALVGGALLWFAFRWLWEWQSVVALVLSAVVIVGLVVVVRVLRRAEDLFSTVLAVLAGLIVTVSPPVLTLTGS
jgi:hypothetical protein